MTPAIAIFAFNRPDSLRRLLQSLECCLEFKGSHVYIFIDGARGDHDASLVRRTSEIARHAGQGKENWHVRNASANRGLRKSIFEGVSEVCSSHGHAIVFEDDLIASPAALTYFIGGLTRYFDEDRVWSICGYAMSSRKTGGSNRAFFLPYAHPWGWATWQRAWRHFDLEEAIAWRPRLDDRSFRRVFNVLGLNAMSDMLRLDRDGLISSWYIRWYSTIFRRGGVSLFPAKSFVENGGLASGTHASRLNIARFIDRSLVLRPTAAPALPSEVLVDYDALLAWRDCFEARVQRAHAFFGMLRRRLSSSRRARSESKL